MADPAKDYGNIIDKELGILLPRFAEKYAFTENAHWTQAELQLIWRTVPVDEIENCVEFAYNYVLPQNFPTKRRYVTDLMVKEIKYPGVWRMVSCGYNTKSQGDPGIMMTLRKGFAQAINWDEALEVEQVDLESDERYILVIFPNFDPEYVDKACAAMRTTPTVTAPTIQGQQRTGDWEYALIHPEKQQDGSFNITVMLSRPQYTLTTYENAGTDMEVTVTHLWGVPKRLAQALITSYHGTVGTSVNATYETATSLQASTVDITITQSTNGNVTLTYQSELGCQVSEYTDIYYNYSKTDMSAKITTVMAARPSGWIYRIGTPHLLASGTYSFEIVRRQAVVATGSEYTESVTVDATTLVQEVKNRPFPWTAVTYVVGVLKRIGARLNEFCTYNTELTTITSRPSANRFVIQLDAAGSRTEEHVFAHNRQVTASDTTPATWPASTFMALHTSATLADTAMFRLDGWTRNIDGTFDWHSIVTNPVGLGNGAAHAINYSEKAEAVYRTMWQDVGLTWHFGYQVSYHMWDHTITQFATEAEAYADLNGLTWYSGMGVTGAEGLGYKAHKIVDGGWSTWTDVGT